MRLNKLSVIRATDFAAIDPSEELRPGVREARHSCRLRRFGPLL